MDFTVRFYFPEHDEDAPPFLEFLKDLQTSQPEVEKLLVTALQKLRNRQYHGPPFTEVVDAEHDILELRVGRTNIARAFFFFRKGREIIVTNGYVKQRQRVDRDELARARRYKRDWERRYP